MKHSPQTDPHVFDWDDIELPDTWADRLVFKRLSDLLLFARKIRGKQIEAVELPEHLPVNAKLPKYILQEFHNLPNGNYSKQISRGYINGFDKSMLGKMAHVRKKIAVDLKGRNSILDIGCAGGKMTDAAQSFGASDVWGLDPSPYLLKHAAAAYPDLKWVQGLAENTGFPDERFEGISVCFVFHEIPPRFINQALQEFHRILQTGGIVSIAEPAPEQLLCSYWQMFKDFGFLGLYFSMLAKKVHEPFVKAWHKLNYSELAEQNGFELLEDDTQMPVRYFVFRKKCFKKKVF